MVLLQWTIYGEAPFRKLTETYKTMTTIVGKFAKLCDLEQNASFCPHGDVQLLAMPKLVAGKKIIKNKFFWHMKKGREVENEH